MNEVIGFFFYHRPYSAMECRYIDFNHLGICSSYNYAYSLLNIHWSSPQFILSPLYIRAFRKEHSDQVTSVSNPTLSWSLKDILIYYSSYLPQ